MTKAIVIRSLGGPEVLKLEDVALEAPGPGEVQIRQAAVGLNFIDVYFRTGLYKTDLPFIPGKEGAGIVTALGEGVTEFALGDRVAYGSSDGAYTAERNVATRHLVRVPDGISLETAAAMMLKGMTAQYLLLQTYQVKPGTVILLQRQAASASSRGNGQRHWARP